jgi:hypothetical protein
MARRKRKAPRFKDLEKDTKVNAVAVVLESVRICKRKIKAENHTSQRTFNNRFVSCMKSEL